MSDRRWKWVSHVLAFVLAFPVFALLHYTIAFFTTDRRDPVRFQSAEATNSPIREGEQLRIVVYREKVRDDCPVTSIRAAQTEDGRMIPLAGRIWNGGPIGDWTALEYDTSILPPGVYTLKVDLQYDCPGDLVFVHHQPDVRFRVLGLGERLN